MHWALVTSVWLLAPSASDTLLYVPVQWPPVGALIGSQYEELSDTPRGIVAMSRNMYLGISRRTTESALEILAETGHVPREGSADALPTEGTRWAVRARLLEFDLSVRRRMVSYVELTLLFVWEVVDLSNNSVVYSRAVDAELETEFVGDQDGTFIFAVRRGFEQALSQLLRDEEFAKALSIAGPSRTTNAVRAALLLPVHNP